MLGGETGHREGGEKELVCRMTRKEDAGWKDEGDCTEKRERSN